MDFLILLGLALAPGVAIILYIYLKDKHEREPIVLILMSFFYGCLSTIVTLIASEPVNRLIQLRRGDVVDEVFDAMFKVDLIEEFITDNSIYIGDGGDIVTFSGGVVQPKAPGHWMDPGPLGTLGVGVPFALATKYARPDKEVVCLFGDGALSLTGWDFETMVRFNLPFVGIVGNNSSMNKIRYGQIQKYGEDRGRVGNTLGDVKYDEFAKMLGGYGEEVRDPKDIAPALQRARESGKPSLINVWVDPDAYAPGTMNQTMYK